MHSQTFIFVVFYSEIKNENKIKKLSVWNPEHWIYQIIVASQAEVSSL